MLRVVGVILQVVGVILQLHTWRSRSEAIVGVTLRSPWRFHSGVTQGLQDLL